MISLESFIKGIHQAITSANESLMQKNLNLLRTFFEPVLANNSGQGRMGALQKTNPKGVSDKEVRTKNVFNSRSKPKCIVVQYPVETVNGIEMIDVEVPLITLIPTGLSQIDKVNVKMDVYLSLNKDGGVNIGFEKPKVKRRPLFHPAEESHSKVGKINITLSPHEGADGLKVLISKYENVLRSQIPN